MHLRGAFHVVRPAFALMCAADYGRIVLTSSIGGLYGNHEVANYAVAKAGVIGLSNVAAIEGAAHNVTSNVIVPAAVTRMAEGIDTSAYPPMGPELVAPVVGCLAHETCSVTGEMFVALAGRVAVAAVTESPGVYRPWLDDRGGGRAARRRSVTCRSRCGSRWCPTGMPTTSGTASQWPRKPGASHDRSEPCLPGRWPVSASSISPRW